MCDTYFLCILFFYGLLIYFNHSIISIWDGCFLVFLLTLNKSKNLVVILLTLNKSKKITAKLPWEKPDAYAFFVYATASHHWHSTLTSQTYEALHQLWALPQHLAFVFCFFECIGIQFFNLPREAEDFPRSEYHSKYVPLPTYLAWLQPIYYNSRFVFIHVNTRKTFTCGENFDEKYRTAATLISNHKLSNNYSLKKYTERLFFLKWAFKMSF